MGLQGPPRRALPEGGQQVDLDVVMILAAARHHHQAAGNELVAFALTLDPGEEVVDVGEHRLRRGGRFVHRIILNLSGRVVSESAGRLQ